MILSLDQQYVRSLTQSLFGDTKVDKAHFVPNDDENQYLYSVLL